MSEISRSSVQLELNQDAHELLQELVTDDGIYASAAIGWEGPYHAWFGRDGAITADLIFASLEYGGDEILAHVALNALINFAKWQGAKNAAATGESIGKIPHEIRTELGETHETQHAADTNTKPWFIDEKDNILKNWDTADGTSLWVLALLRGHEKLGRSLEPETEQHLKAALSWIMTEIDRYDGFVGFTGASLQAGREYSGLHNQGWKDTTDVYQRPESGNAPHPIKDVLVNAEAWAALCDGAEYFADIDQTFSATLSEASARLKLKFNSTNEGFTLPDGSGLAQAIDGNNEQLTQASVDQAAVLWARTRSGDICVDQEMARRIVEQVMSEGMFNPDAGIRDYARGTVFTHGTDYHGSTHTYWPFMSGLAARGMEQAGFRAEAERTMTAYLAAIETLGTNIEMFVQNADDEFEPWAHPDPEIGQKSSREQAWTAAAVYYATQYLLSQNRSIHDVLEST